MKKIIIIDEEPWYLDSLKDLLTTNLKVEVIIFYDAEEGLDYLEKNSANLIILDILLPLRNLSHHNEEYSEFKNAGGLIVLDLIVDSSYEKNVICYTILTDSSIKNKINETPNAYYLDKSSDIKSFLNAVKEHIL